MVNWGAFLSEASLAFIRRIRTRARMEYKYSDAEVTLSSDITKTLSGCSPVSDHLDAKQIKQICVALGAENELKARQLIEAAKIEGGQAWCIDALKLATTMICSCGPTVLKEATFNLLGC